MANEAKAKGNAAFSAGKYTEATTHFTEAINLAPPSHVFYSNRPATYASLNQFKEALSDAQKTVELKPDRFKFYSRLDAAHHGLRQYTEAISAYKKGLEVDPNNEILKSELVDAQSAKKSRRPSAAATNMLGDAFGPDMWAKLTADRTTRLFMQQPNFVKTM